MRFAFIVAAVSMSFSAAFAATPSTRSLQFDYRDLTDLYGLRLNRLEVDGVAVFTLDQEDLLAGFEWQDGRYVMDQKVKPGSTVTATYEIYTDDGEYFSFVDSPSVTFAMPQQDVYVGTGTPYVPATTFCAEIKGETLTRVAQTPDELKDLFAKGGSACLGGLLELDEDLTVASGVSVRLFLLQCGEISLGSHSIVNAGSLELISEDNGCGNICSLATGDDSVVYNTGRLLIDGPRFAGSSSDRVIVNAGEMHIGYATVINYDDILLDAIYLAAGSTTYFTDSFPICTMTLAYGAAPVVIPRLDESICFQETSVWFEKLDAQGERTLGVVAVGSVDNKFPGAFGASGYKQAVRRMDDGTYEIVPSVTLTVDVASIKAANLKLVYMYVDDLPIRPEKLWTWACSLADKGKPVTIEAPEGAPVIVGFEPAKSYCFLDLLYPRFGTELVASDSLVIDADLPGIARAVPVHMHGGTEFTPVSKEASLREALEYGFPCYLYNDITLTNDLVVKDRYYGSLVIVDKPRKSQVCLNGKVLNQNGFILENQIDLSLQDCSCGVAHRFSSSGPDGRWTLDEESGMMTVTGGVITAGGGVVNRRYLWMSDCNIVGCSGADSGSDSSGCLGGGLYVGSRETEARCSITGNVSIIGNVADCGGGVYVERESLWGTHPQGYLALSGRVNIYGNTARISGPNLALSAGLTLGLDEAGLGEGSHVGLTLLDAKGASVTGVVSSVCSQPTGFFADDPGLSVACCDTRLELVEQAGILFVARGEETWLAAASAEQAVSKCAMVIVSPDQTIVDDKAYAAYFKLVAKPVPGAAGLYAVCPALDESVLGLAVSTADLASGLCEVASGHATVLPVAGCPGLSYSVCYGSTPSALTGQGASVRCPSSGVVNVPMPTLSSSAMFYVLRISE